MCGSCRVSAQREEAGGQAACEILTRVNVRCAMAGSGLLCLVATGRMGLVWGDGAAWTSRRRQRIGKRLWWPTRLLRAWSTTSLATSRAPRTFQMSSSRTWGGGLVCDRARRGHDGGYLYHRGIVFLLVAEQNSMAPNGARVQRGRQRKESVFSLKKKKKAKHRPGQCHATTLASAKLSSPSLVPISPMLASAPALPALSPPPSPPLP